MLSLSLTSKLLNANFPRLLLWRVLEHIAYPSLLGKLSLFPLPILLIFASLVYSQIAQVLESKICFPASQPAAEAKGSIATSAESLPDSTSPLPGSHVEKTNQRAHSPRASKSSIDSGAVPSSPERTPTRPSSNNRYTPKQSPRYGIYA